MPDGTAARKHLTDGSLWTGTPVPAASKKPLTGNPHRKSSTGGGYSTSRSLANREAASTYRVCGPCLAAWAAMRCIPARWATGVFPDTPMLLASQGAVCAERPEMAHGVTRSKDQSLCSELGLCPDREDSGKQQCRTFGKQCPMIGRGQPATGCPRDSLD